MSREIAERDVPAHPGIPQREAGPVLLHRVVPADLALADERGQHRRGEALRDGGELEHGVLVDLLRLAHLADAEAAHVDGAVAGDHRHGRAVYVRCFGVREVGKPEKVDKDTVFQLASISTSFTTTMLAALVGEREIGWDL